MRGRILVTAGVAALVTVAVVTAACDRVSVRRTDTAGGAGGAAGSSAAQVDIEWVGSWQPGPTMGTPRSGHAAVAFPDGRVLVSGGIEDQTGSVRSAEVYDPTRQSWEPVGVMSRARSQHTATMLPSGEVLVVGGDEYGNLGSDTWPPARVTDPSAEVFDPATGEWRVTAPPGVARFDHTATLLLDGRVMVVGGHEDGESAEIYDPSTETWQNPAEGHVSPDGWHTAALLPDGRVIVAGGWGAVEGRETAKLYDPAMDSWDSTKRMTDRRLMHTATVLKDGRVLVAGGADDKTVKYAARSVEIYDLDTGVWQAVTGMRKGRSMHAATLLDSGQVLITGGGIRKGFEMIADSEVYDPTADTWVMQPPMSTPRAHHSATLMPDGSVMVAGGTRGVRGGPYVSQDSVVFFWPPMSQ